MNLKYLVNMQKYINDNINKEYSIAEIEVCVNYLLILGLTETEKCFNDKTLVAMIIEFIVH